MINDLFFFASGASMYNFADDNFLSGAAKAVIELKSTLQSILGIQLDDKPNFSLHVSNICKSAANQLSSLIRLNNFLCFNRKRVLINSYFMSNLYYCLLVWIFSNAKSLKRIGNLQKAALRFLYNNYQLSYEELLYKVKSSTMNVKRLRFLCVEIYKTINNLNPSLHLKGLWSVCSATTICTWSKPQHSLSVWGSSLPLETTVIRSP